MLRMTFKSALNSSVNYSYNEKVNHGKQESKGDKE
jgi:hypothetical protein